jgi:hypothetical protein
MDRNELPLNTRHLVVPSGVPKMISMPVAHLAQTVHPSNAEINTISKQTKRASTWPTLPRSTIRCAKNDFHAVVHSALTCTYLALRLMLSLNGPKQASTWPTSPTIRCAQNGFHASGTFGANLDTHLVLRLTLSLNELKHALTWPMSPRSTIGCDQNYFQAYGLFDVNRAPILCRDYQYLQID